MKHKEKDRWLIFSPKILKPSGLQQLDEVSWEH